MSYNTFGHIFRVTTWGESHGPRAGRDRGWLPAGDRRGRGRPAALAGPPPSGAEPLYHPATRAGPGRDPLRRLRGPDHRASDPADDPQPGPALEGLFRHRRQVPPRPCRLYLLDQVRHPRSSRRRPGLGPRDGGPGGGRRGRPGGARPTWRRGWSVRGCMVQMGPHRIDRDRWDWDAVEQNPFWTPDAAAAEAWATYLDDLRKSGESCGAVIEVVCLLRARPVWARRSTASWTPTWPRR